MPRRAPDQVQEHRITFGNYERQFVTEVKADVEKTVKVATITAVAVPLATIGGFGLLGYGIYKAGIMIGKGLNEFQLMDWDDTGLSTPLNLTGSFVTAFNPFMVPTPENIEKRAEAARNLAVYFGFDVPSK